MFSIKNMAYILTMYLEIKIFNSLEKPLIIKIKESKIFLKN